MTYKEYVQEEKNLSLKRFTNEDAKQLAEFAMAWSMEKYGMPITVEVNRNGKTIYYHAMTGTTDNNKMWMDRKKTVVELFQNSSMGAAITGGVGVGLFKDFSVIDDFLDIDCEHTPNEALGGVYAQQRKIFDSCYDALKPVFGKMK